MEISGVRAPSTDQLGSVQGQAQISVLKKQLDLQEQGVAQLLQAIPQPQAVEPGRPGGIINTFA